MYVKSYTRFRIQDCVNVNEFDKYKIRCFLSDKKYVINIHVELIREDSKNVFFKEKKYKC